MKLVPFATRVRMDVKAFPSRPIAADATQIAFLTVLIVFLVTQVRNCEGESRILNDLHRITCGLRHPMKLVPFATRVRMDVKAFPSRPSNRYVAVHPSILFLIAMDYVIRKLFSRSQWHSEIAFPTVLMFFLDTPGYASGYASGNFLKISNFLKYSPRLYPQATPKGN
ncbi:hypothetical protein T05_8066 [Trichinella murrelli]|uniref:Transmembrane protein n=1 Tax=Trichinella murrelli TaxID=144512 RepID=A0A0V0UBP9_9BILA|nr:hypothetical protein T05_8066 [Trichinella murrelli]